MKILYPVHTISTFSSRSGHKVLSMPELSMIELSMVELSIVDGGKTIRRVAHYATRLMVLPQDLTQR